MLSLKGGGGGASNSNQANQTPNSGRCNFAGYDRDEAPQSCFICRQQQKRNGQLSAGFNAVESINYNSSSELANSNNLISCSTCCSLASSTLSRSELGSHQTSGSSQSISDSHSMLGSHSTNSSSVSDYFLPTVKQEHSQSSSATSSTDNNNHQPHHHHHHHHRHHHHHLAILCQHRTIDHESHLCQHSKSHETIATLQPQALATCNDLTMPSDSGKLIDSQNELEVAGCCAKQVDNSAEPQDGDGENKFHIRCDVLGSL